MIESIKVRWRAWRERRRIDRAWRKARRDWYELFGEWNE